MKHFIFVLILSITACKKIHQTEQPTNITQDLKKEVINDTKDVIEIRDVIRKMLKWSENNDLANDFYSFITTKKGRYISINQEQLDKNAENLKQSGFFTDEFIENYKKIFLKQAESFKNGEAHEGEIINAFGEANPWCNCQDVPGEEGYDYFRNVRVEKIKLSENEGEFYWKWEQGIWEDFKYNFKVKKEHNKWQISYLERFQL